MLEVCVNLSGIAVTAEPEWAEAVASALALMPGVEVFHTDAASGKLVIVQEAASVGDEVTGFKAIRSLPHVIAADLVYHYFEEDNDIIPALPDEFAGLENTPVPAELQG